MFEVTIVNSEANQKVFKFVKKYLSNAPLSLIYKTFRKKDVKVNGKRVDENYILKENDLLQIYLPKDFEKETNEKSLLPTKITFKVLYEDSNILAVYKPQGLLVVEDQNEKSKTLSNQILVYLKDKGEYNPQNVGFTPAPVHRIDRNTSGIVLIAKNMITSQELSLMFKNRTNIKKTYLALVKGYVKENGTIDKNLIKDSSNSLVRTTNNNEGQKAITCFEIKERLNEFTLLSVNIKTGRTHQIRVHLSSINHPLVGDSKYGDFELNKKIKKIFNWENQFLHASSISFEGIKGYLSYLNDITINCPLPEENKILLNKLRSEV